MTARPALRRRRTMAGAIVIVVLIAAAAVLGVVGANSVADSTAGGTVAGEDRPVIELPNTDNAALAVVDVDGRLASLVIATLLPGGSGGSVVTIPVNADANGGLEPIAQPLDGLIEVDEPTAFFESVENTVGVSLRFGEIVGAERLAELVESVTPVPVDLATDITDGLLGAVTTVVEAGEEELDAQQVGAALSAVDRSKDPALIHADDVAVWSALAAHATGVSESADDSDDDEQSIDTIDDVFDRLWSGAVQVRDLQIQEDAVVDGAVVLSRRDVVVVFAQISPTRVAAPEAGLIFRVVVPFSDEQIEDTDGLFESRSEIARTVVGEMLFFQNNVISVDTAPAEDGAGEVTQLLVADEQLVDEMADSAFVIYGEAEASPATELVEGIDVVVVLGTSYFDHQASVGEVTDDESVAAEADIAATVVPESDEND